jgi:hypothetical protein
MICVFVEKKLEMMRAEKKNMSSFLALCVFVSKLSSQLVVYYLITHRSLYIHESCESTHYKINRIIIFVMDGIYHCCYRLSYCHCIQLHCHYG